MDALKLDHCVIHVSDWERSNRFYAAVLGAEILPRQNGFTYKLGDILLNCHGPGIAPNLVARNPVQPGNSDLCFAWPGTIESAIAHLQKCGVAVELGPVATRGAKGEATSVYFRDPDGSLLEFMAYPTVGA
ncbi:VOC family protein [Methylovirgula sp. HY1]|uniref:VOC family protein n=1 Tax=Methylovirgula sp. HY1 TaxID=2822761 RepID=UPI001C5BBE3A|nr:VOC family protein [Methylovirgula sp. HY1]QXX73585.1 Virulence protein [Methylovirgula sp. HY1]